MKTDLLVPHSGDAKNVLIDPGFSVDCNEFSFPSLPTREAVVPGKGITAAATHHRLPC